jgi:hypothetical protein
LKEGEVRIFFLVSFMGPARAADAASFAFSVRREERRVWESATEPRTETERNRAREREREREGVRGEKERREPPHVKNENSNQKENGISIQLRCSM